MEKKEGKAMQAHLNTADPNPGNLGCERGREDPIPAEGESQVKPSYVVVGVLCRVHPPSMEQVCALINSMDGMETFSLGESGRVGALIEAESFDRAHERLQEELLQIEGVQAAWPVSTQWE